MRISDWSSDMCSSDLHLAILHASNFTVRSKAAVYFLNMAGTGSAAVGDGDSLPPFDGDIVSPLNVAGCLLDDSAAQPRRVRGLSVDIDARIYLDDCVHGFTFSMSGVLGVARGRPASKTRFASAAVIIPMWQSGRATCRESGWRKGWIA